ncbi:MAG: DUF6691 family protein [Myxococcota bacterium]
MKQQSVAFIAGLVFAAGLALGGMTLPSKVIGFFDFSDGFASWDPSLAFVMGGGLLVFMPVLRLAQRRGRPIFGDRFRLPTRTDIDLRLIGGAALFGIGWGLAGYCPGPALASAGYALTSGAFADSLVLVLSMLVGMKLAQRFFTPRSIPE